MAQPLDAVSAQRAGDVFPVLGGDGVSITTNGSLCAGERFGKRRLAVFERRRRRFPPNDVV